MIRAIALSLLLAAMPVTVAPRSIGAARQSTGTPVSMLAQDTESRWVPFDKTPGNQIRFTMMLDGRQATAILDTGVSASVLSRDFATRARLAIAPGGSARAIGGSIPLGWVATRHLALGGLTRTGGGLNVVALPARATGADTPVDLLVGRDLIGGYALDIDYAARRFRLLASGRMPFRGASAPLSLSPVSHVYQSELTLGGRTLKPVIVDTGDGSAVTLSQDAWAWAEPHPPAMTSAVSFGLGGSIETALAVMPTLALGTLVAHEVEIRVEGRDGFSQGIGAAGRIGSGFLERYRVLLDPGAGHMVLRPAASADAPPLRSTSGLLLRQDGDRLDIVHVMRGGPAEAGGWKTGEAICSVDGMAIGADYAHSALADWSVGAPGRTVALGLCDGSARRLTLRRFY